MRSIAKIGLCMAMLCLWVGGCSQDSGVYEYRRRRAKHSSPSGKAARSGAVSSTQGVPFHWKVPAGWRVVKHPSAMRLATFVVEGHSQAECSVVLLRGSGGSALGNVNRWRGQMGLPPIDAGALASHLHPIEMGGVKGQYVVLDGDYQAMGSNLRRKGYRMMVAFARTRQGALFVKFVGPKAVVERESGKFLSLVRSIHPARGHFHGAKTSGMAAAKASFRPLSWKVPSSWQVVPPRSSIYIGAFRPRDGVEAECTVSFFPRGGRVLDNVNRWRRQMGLEPVSEDNLKRISIAGFQGVLVDLQGNYRGMGMGAAKKGYRMLGLICPTAKGVIFVKMVGPAAVVGREKGAFLAFCRSLKVR
ncbi:MAG: hypothetical protein D6805_00295 [Planctomycetota bacterium]|nr:MAG: hypothetical protein D6805_00295 [Planctomycetota bacterium]